MYCYKMIHAPVLFDCVHYDHIRDHTHTHTCMCAHAHTHTESLSSIPCGMGWVINGVSLHYLLLTIYLHYLSLYINKNNSSQK